MCRIIVLSLTFLLCSTSLFAKEWEPIGTWPFEYQTFQVATVYSGIYSIKKTQVPCNIHLGKQTLWFSQNDTLMEAVKGSIIRVEFKNGNVFIPVNGGECMGKIEREDTLSGKVGRVLHVRLVDQNAVDQRAIDLMNKSQNLQQSSLNLGTWGAQLSDINATINEEELPIPLINVFYFQYKGEIFEAKEKQILSHINPARKREYKNYTRKAEIISTNKSSMLKVWEDFFVNY